VAEEVQEEAGFGIRGTVDGKLWEIKSGGPGKVLVRGGVAAAGDATRERRGEDKRGRENRGEQEVSWAITLGDRVREDSRATVEEILVSGRKVVLVTGDVQEAADRMASEAGIDKALARMDPTEKADWIRAHRDRGEVVLFAGDGMNDGPGLAQADVGIAMGTGAASSILVADGVISVPSLRPILAGFRAAEAAADSIRKNQVRSIVYNIAAVSFAAAGMVNPLIAAILMPLSSGMVIWGASRVEKAVEAGESAR
jgi:cation-transporting P-type ATPase A/B